MHPVLARYLNLETAQETLSRADRGDELAPDERAFAQAARAAPEQRQLLDTARSTPAGGPNTQQALLILAAHAAARALSDDDAFSTPMGKARQVLADEGASREEADQFLASLVLEEAFGYEDDAARFDAPFFRETLGSVEPLARLTTDRVHQLISDFSAQAPGALRGTHEAVARAMVEAAWDEGPQPVNPEHVETVLAGLAEKASESERKRRFEALRAFLKFLAAEGYAGPLRLARLEQRALTAAVELGIPSGARPH